MVVHISQLMLVPVKSAKAFQFDFESRNRGKNKKGRNKFHFNSIALTDIYGTDCLLNCRARHKLYCLIDAIFRLLPFCKDKFMFWNDRVIFGASKLEAKTQPLSLRQFAREKSFYFRRVQWPYISHKLFINVQREESSFLRIEPPFYVTFSLTTI